MTNLTEARLWEIEKELLGAITDVRQSPLTMKHTVRCAAAVLQLIAGIRAVTGFKPDAEHINALPEPLRRYIHDIETRSDPAGDVRVIAVLQETVTALGIIRDESEAEIGRLRARVDELLRANNAEVERRRQAERQAGIWYRLTRAWRAFVHG